MTVAELPPRTMSETSAPVSSKKMLADARSLPPRKPRDQQGHVSKQFPHAQGGEQVHRVALVGHNLDDWLASHQVRSPAWPASQARWQRWSPKSRSVSVSSPRFLRYRWHLALLQRPLALSSPGVLFHASIPASSWREATS
jgi:hypothetical protein